ncbi:TonB-dependent siderophore receptor [Thauera linaloolentis]|uniref:TonB-dependent siderophore receptor n=1 Tax=Thauera linaloolentis (strain DSM 12138 / JCM 21573 / CCUG 41526 / CIP 105981 / IAM 15112 / NBRC 102519 / 47Lol) TaxID=1123367 RepID=N6YB73_THAL4|nr:TonB-dependent receptor [Thauera linaloolentis]ENO88755.1 TonB-dependent siderophore receptor [Thauera linaloolentis 47Lol = DSM 12138]MCM8564936.1 TonB-dependent receptor [Thauera linaloolentis]
MSKHPPKLLRPLALALHLAFLGTAGATLALPGTARAQEAAFDFAIPAGPLQSALTAFSAQTRINVSFTPEITGGGRHSPGVQGSHTAAQALSRLLAGSGLIALRQGNGFTLERAPQSGGYETQLVPVTVTAGADRSGTTEGTGSYTQRGPSRTATGLSLSLRETPQSVTVMTHQRIEDFKLETLTEVLEQTPGIAVHQYGTAVGYQARGAAVNFQTDGFRQISGGWSYFGGMHYDLDDLTDIDRVEVLKGSAGLTAGYGYAGATVNRIRKRPTQEFQAKAGVSAGRWDKLRAEADLSGPLNAAGTLRGRIAAAAGRGDTFRDGETQRFRTVFGTLEADIGPDTLLSGGITYRKREHRGIALYDAIPAYRGGQHLTLAPRSFNLGTPWSGYEQETTSLFARLEHRFATGWTASLHVSDERIETPELLFGYIRWPGTANQNHYLNAENRNSAIDFELKGPFEMFGRQHELRIAAGAARSDSDMDRANGTYGVPLADFGLDYAQGGSALPKFADMSQWTYDPDHFSHRQRYVSAAGRFSLAEPLKLIAGVRVTDYRLSSFGGQWMTYALKESGVVTPYAGLVLDIDDDISVYGSYANIFEAQTAQDEQGHTLPPREGLTYEVGAKGEFFGKRLNTSISHFWVRTDNEAEASGGRTPGGATAYRPVMGASRRGYELELSGELARGWQAQGSYVMNDSSLSTASQYPKRQLKLATTYQPWHRLTIGASTRWQSKTSGGELAQDSFWLLDLMTRYQINDKLSISANINNALDKEYFGGIVSDWQGVGYTWGTPRSFNASLRYDF